MANLDHIFVSAVACLGFRPHVQKLLGAAIERTFPLLDQVIQGCSIAAFLGQHLLDRRQLLSFSSYLGLRCRPLVIATNGLRDLGQITLPLRRHNYGLFGGETDIDLIQMTFILRQSLYLQCVSEFLK